MVGSKGHNDLFVINDIELRIAPTNISISKDSLNYQWQTLRTTNSQIKKSGHSVISINFTVPFVGINDINNKLRPLIAQLRYMPFCYVENQFLRENIYPMESSSGTDTDTKSQTTIVLAMRGINISTRNSTPDTLWVSFSMAYFNYFPYVPYWQYKDDLFGNKTETLPKYSDAWKKFVAPAISDTKPIIRLDEGTSLEYFDIRTIPSSSVQSLETSKKILEELGGADREKQSALLNNIRKNISSDANQTIANGIKNTLVGFKDFADPASLDLIVPLLIDAGPKSNPNSIRYQNSGQFINQDKLQEAITQIDSRIRSRKQLDRTEEGSFTLIPGLEAIDNRGDGFGVFSRFKSFSLEASKGIIVENINISIQNILATLPLLGQKYATFQHIGSIDALVTFDLKVTSDEGMKTLSGFYDTINENSLNNRHVPQGFQNIQFNNNVLKLFNLKEFVTQDMVICTIPGQPGTYDVKLSLIESGVKSTDSLDNNTNEKFRVEFAASDPRLISEVIKILGRYVLIDSWDVWGKGRAPGDVVSFMPLTLPEKDSRFSKYVTMYTTGRNLFEGNDINLIATTTLNKFVDEIQRIVFNEEKPYLLDALFSFTDDQLPGSSRIKEIIHARGKAKYSLSKSSIANKFGPSLQDSITSSKSRINTEDTIARLKKQKDLFKKFNFVEQDFENFKQQQSDSLHDKRVSELKDFMTPEEEEFNKQIQSDPTALLTMKPFIQWNEFVANITKTIVNSDDINLPQFASVKKLAATNNINHGLPAYNDFRMERLVEDKSDVSQILSLDPDCFLSSPIDTDINTLIDPILIMNAKKAAMDGFNSSISQIEKHYTDSYLPSFISKNIQDKIIANISEGIKQYEDPEKKKAIGQNKGIDPYYRGSTNTPAFSNAGKQDRKEPLTIGRDQTLLDKARDITSSVDLKVNFAPANTLMHSLNPSSLVQDTVYDVDSLDQIIIDGTPEPNSKGGKFANGSLIARPLNGELKIASSKGSFWAARTAPVNGNPPLAPGETRAHKGIDLLAKIGDPIYCLADGTIMKIGYGKVKSDGKIAEGFRVFVSHAGGFTSNYFHMNQPAQVGIGSFVIKNKVLKVGDQVKCGQLIGTVGRTGVYEEKTPTHLHLQCTELNAFIDPGKFLSIVPYNGSKAQTPLDNHGAKNGPPATGIGANVNVTDLAIKEFETSLRNGQGQRLIRAFPAYKLYFIQNNSGNRRRYGLDDFFSYNSVVDITCIRSRKIAADYLELTLTNISGTLSNRKFQGARKVSEKFPDGEDISNSPVDKLGNILKKDPNGFLTRDSQFENPLASLMLQPGIEIELRLGYANDPDKLTTVFVGKIMEVEFSDSDDLIKIACQSHAIELQQDMKGMAKVEEQSGWTFASNDARTDSLLEKMIAQPEVVHFGRWERSKTTDTDSNKNRFLLTDKFRLSPTPADDNIFPPSIEVMKQLDDGLIFSNLKYSIYQTTIWDIFEEMTLRHPGWIKSPVPYKDKYGTRMTMFFGLPSQLYFSADPTMKELSEGGKLKAAISKLNDNPGIQALAEVLKDPSAKPKLTSFVNNSVLKLIEPSQLNRDFEAERLELAKDFKSVKPFRDYHLITSKQHIISNNIRASAKNTFNTISVQYGETTLEPDTKQLIQQNWDIFTLPFDSALPDEDIREMFAQYVNCQHKYMAKQYATSLLLKALKEVYRGEITIIGNPNIKPYDIVLIHDDYSDLMGPVEVEQVIHRFSQDTGFVTEITPDLFVTANEWVNMTASDLMSLVIEGTCSKLTNTTPTHTEQVLNSGKNGIIGGIALGSLALVSLPALLIGAGLVAGGYFISQKLVDFTSHGQPVVIHPLLHHGKPFVAGLPITKLNNLWSVNRGQWLKEGLEGIDLFLDDLNDKLVLAPSTGSITNLFSGSTKGPKF